MKDNIIKNSKVSNWSPTTRRNLTVGDVLQASEQSKREPESKYQTSCGSESKRNMPSRSSAKGGR